MSRRRESKSPIKVWGTDCVAANIVLQLNKMWYKDVKGDPRGFATFLDAEGLPTWDPSSVPW